MSSANDYGALDDSLRDIELREQPYQDYDGAEDTPILPARTVERKKGFCEKVCCCCAPRDESRKNTSSSWCCLNMCGILNFILVVAAIGYMYYYTRETNTRFEMLQNDMAAMQKNSDDRYDTLLAALNAEQRAEQQFESRTKSRIAEVEEKFQSYSDALDEQERQLIRLSNGTSNADVLDRLKETREEVRYSLQREHKEVSALMQQTARNLTESLAQNNKQLAVTQSRVYTTLNSTVAYMQSVVGTASAHIQQIQTNVTREIDDMTQKVHKIVTKLGDNVKAAEDTIREEVQGVQAKIEQYVIVTNKQFAAENDFVKYQLAGTHLIYVYLCLFYVW